MVGGFHGMLLLSTKTFKISCQMGRHHMKEDLENHLKARLFRLERWYNITEFLRQNKQDCISLEQKFCQVFFSVMHYTQGESG